MKQAGNDEEFSFEQLKSGGNQAWARAYPLLRSQVTAFLKSQLSDLNDQDLEEVTNDAILVGHDQFLATAKDAEEFKRLLFTTAKNKAWDLIRKRRAEKAGGGKVGSLEELPQGMEIDSGEDHPDTILGKKERQSLFRRALAKIPKKYARILFDLHFRRLKHEEVAQKHGLKLGSIGVYNKRAMQMLGVASASVCGSKISVRRVIEVFKAKRLDASEGH